MDEAVTNLLSSLGIEATDNPTNEEGAGATATQDENPGTVDNPVQQKDTETGKDNPPAGTNTSDNKGTEEGLKDFSKAGAAFAQMRIDNKNLTNALRGIAQGLGLNVANMPQENLVKSIN